MQALQHSRLRTGEHVAGEDGVGMQKVPGERRPVAVLGVTGMVGQRMLSILEEHPWFRVGCVAASERSAGRKLGDVARWHLTGTPFGGVGDQEIAPCDPDRVIETLGGAGIVFSALPSDVARDLEPAAVDQLREADADLADREDQLRKTRARIQSERSAQETILRSFREPS